VDPSTTLARAKPVIVTASPLRLNRDEDVIGIKQANGRVQMRQIGPTLAGLTFKTFKDAGHFQSFLAQRRDNRLLAHHHHLSPAKISRQDKGLGLTYPLIFKQSRTSRRM
jgi:hypothetical protein